VSDDLHRHGRCEVRLRHRDRRRVHRQQRLQLPDAHAGVAVATGQATQNHSSCRSAGWPVMSAVSQFKSDARRVAADLHHRALVLGAMDKYETAGGRTRAAFQDWQSARALASHTKRAALAKLDTHLEQFTAQLEARGTKVHWAS